MSKQTAVEWLAEQYVDSAGILSPIDIQNALHMEREQIEHAWHDGHSPYGFMFVGNYMEQTYGKEASNES